MERKNAKGKRSRKLLTVVELEWLPPSIEVYISIALAFLWQASEKAHIPARARWHFVLSDMLRTSFAEERFLSIIRKCFPQTRAPNFLPTRN